jgi:TPR repeat protein
MRVWAIAMVAAASLTLGFVLGVYKEPIGETVTRAARVLGLARPDSRAAAHAAYQQGRYTTALQLARPLAEQGDARAQTILGLMYAKGEGVPQNHGEAVKWYRLAADQHDAQAQYQLAFLYAIGDGVAQDYVAAHMWFNLAGANFPASDARRRLAIANRDAVESKMTREQVAEAQERARDCKPK